MPPRGTAIPRQKCQCETLCVRLEPGRKIRPFILDVSDVICEQLRNLYVFPEGD